MAMAGGDVSALLVDLSGLQSATRCFPRWHAAEDARAVLVDDLELRQNPRTNAMVLETSEGITTSGATSICDRRKSTWPSSRLETSVWARCRHASRSLYFKNPSTALGRRRLRASAQWWAWRRCSGRSPSCQPFSSARRAGGCALRQPAATGAGIRGRQGSPCPATGCGREEGVGRNALSGSRRRCFSSGVRDGVVSLGGANLGYPC